MLPSLENATYRLMVGICILLGTLAIIRASSLTARKGGQVANLCPKGHRANIASGISIISIGVMILGSALFDAYLCFSFGVAWPMWCWALWFWVDAGGEMDKINRN